MYCIEYLQLQHCLLNKRHSTLAKSSKLSVTRGGQKKFSLPVRVNMMITANMSGYFANIPGAFMDMYSLQNCSMRLPTNSSKVALHARATLEVPEVEKDHLR